MDAASGPWILILDADERLTPELRKEIAGAIKEDTHNGFYVARKNFFIGRWIRHGGWWPDYTMRLFRKDKGRFEDREVHEKVVVDGSISRLKNPIEHYTYNSIAEFIQRSDRYSSLAAKELERKGFNSGPFDLIVRPAFTFTKMFFLRLGFLDGIHGLILAVLYGYYTFLKYAKVWEMRMKQGEKCT